MTFDEMFRDRWRFASATSACADGGGISMTAVLEFERWRHPDLSLEPSLVGPIDEPRSRELEIVDDAPFLCL